MKTRKFFLHQIFTTPRSFIGGIICQSLIFRSEKPILHFAASFCVENRDFWLISPPFGTPCNIRVPHCHTLYLLMYNKWFLKHFKVKYHTFGCNMQHIHVLEILGAN